MDFHRRKLETTVQRDARLVLNDTEAVQKTPTRPHPDQQTNDDAQPGVAKLRMHFQD